MSTGQTLITLGALMLLSLTIINVNRSLNENEELLNKTRFGVEAIALATSIIEEASQLPFDEVSWDSTKIEKKVSDFTIPANLGPESDEIDYASFDDFDDFNDYTKAETTMQNIYDISCLVGYIDPSNPDVLSTSRKYYKKLMLFITNPTSNDTLNMNYIHGYWYYN